MEKLRGKLSNDIMQKIWEAEIESLFQILTKSTTELQNLTTLSRETIVQIKKICANLVLNQGITSADQVLEWERISTGCSLIDCVLRGGFPINGITEIFGCSGVGKTQMCLQLSIMCQMPKEIGGRKQNVIYISTEDVFPSKRFHQLTESFKTKYNFPHLDFESNVHLQHIADYEMLRRLLIKLPSFCEAKSIGLIVIDSIAGLFRSENEHVSYINRSQEFVTLASMLNKLHDKQGCAIVCVNQVTDNINTNESEPCLGLAWSNNVTSRFKIERYIGSAVRKFEVVFAPDLPCLSCNFTICTDGIVES